MRKLSIQRASLLRFILFSLFVITFTSCAHHRDVRPGAEGTHTVVVRGGEKESAEREAISQANHYCKQFDQYAAFVNENTKYTGDMDESTRKNVRNASKAAMVVGSGMGVLGGRKERGAGAVVGGAGTVGHIMTGEDAYTSEMKFVCK